MIYKHVHMCLYDQKKFQSKNNLRCFKCSAFWFMSQITDDDHKTLLLLVVLVSCSVMSNLLQPHELQHALESLRTKLVEVTEFQLSSFKSWKMMLWKCCTQYASKFGKLSSGHRTGLGQFSFQSQRRAISMNGKTTAQLHSSHTLARIHAQNPSSQASTVHGPRTPRCTGWI